MISGTGGTNNSNNVAVAGDTATRGASGGPGGLLNNTKDAKEASTEAKFGDVLNNIQSKYGAKPKQQREIKKTLGKDDFLRIMITQMKNQDPTAPFKAEQMAAEMAQFASVEQLSNINQNLGKLQNQNQPLERLAMTNMIGKVVTVDRERFAHVEGQNESLTFNLPKDAKEVKVLLISDAGETVLEKTMGPQKAGEVQLSWDGKKTNTLPAKGGTYMIRVDARGEKDESIQTNPMAQARVVGISFEGAEPAFLVGDANHQDKITFKQIVKIDEGAPAAAGSGAAPGGAITPVGQQPNKTNFVAFQKGEGSTNLDPNQAGSEVAEALAKFQADQEATKRAEAAQKAALERSGAAAKATDPVKPEERGFPNGLRDPDEGTSPAQAGEPSAGSLHSQKGGKEG
jgi:flagellar basal-body rod modification protein FlgD